MNSNNELDILHHVTIQVADISKSITWYETSFSCRILSRSLTNAVLEFANVRITLVLPSQEPAHVAFVRSDAESFGDLRERPDGLFSTYVSDPTGNVVELVAREKMSQTE